MRYINKFILFIICVGMLAGCGEKKEENLTANLSSELLLDEDGASAVCVVDNDYSETEGFVTGAKFVIFADKDGVVTKVVTRQVASSNDKKTLTNMQDTLVEKNSTASQYGGYNSEIKLIGNKLYVDTEIDYTKLNLEEMLKESEGLDVYLNDDYQFTLSSIQLMYMSSGASCNEK